VSDHDVLRKASDASKLGAGVAASPSVGVSVVRIALEDINVGLVVGWLASCVCGAVLRCGLIFASSRTNETSYPVFYSTFPAFLMVRN
jgi:hypothetical protein